MRNFRNWLVWQESKIFVSNIYQLTASFPQEEKFGLTNQMRRAAVSIPANIAEGAGRNTEKELRQFLNIAMGSAFEVETMLEIAADLAYIDSQQLKSSLDKITIIEKRLNSFIQKLKAG